MLQAGKTVSRRFCRLACWRHIPQAPSWQNCVLRLRTVRRFFAISGFQNRVARRSRRWRRWLEERRLSSQASRRCGGEPAGVRIIVATVAIVAQYVISYCSPMKSFVSLPGAKPWKRCLFEANTKFFLILFLSSKSITHSPERRERENRMRLPSCFGRFS